MSRLLLAALLLVLALPSAAMELKDLDGRPVKVSELEAELIVLNFWATWCKPCREEMPILVALQRELGPRGLRIVAASADEPGSEKRIARAARDWPGLLILQGANVEDLEFFGLGSALPATAVFDSHGHLVHRVQGVVEAGAFRQVLLDVLAGKGHAASDDVAPPVAELPHSHGEPDELAEALPAGKRPRARKRSSLVPS